MLFSILCPRDQLPLIHSEEEEENKSEQIFFWWENIIFVFIQNCKIISWRVFDASENKKGHEVADEEKQKYVFLGSG